MLFVCRPSFFWKRKLLVRCRRRLSPTRRRCYDAFKASQFFRFELCDSHHNPVLLFARVGGFVYVLVAVALMSWWELLALVFTEFAERSSSKKLWVSYCIQVLQPYKYSYVREQKVNEEKNRLRTLVEICPALDKAIAIITGLCLLEPRIKNPVVFNVKLLSKWVLIFWDGTFHLCMSVKFTSIRHSYSLSIFCHILFFSFNFVGRMVTFRKLY